MKKSFTIIAFIASAIMLMTSCTSSAPKDDQKENAEEQVEHIKTKATKQETASSLPVKKVTTPAKNNTAETTVKTPQPVKQERTPGETMMLMAKKHKIAGVWDLGGGSNSKRFATIYHDGKTWQYGILNVEKETLEDCDEPLKKINANTYKGYASYDMPERLVINEAGNLDSYVYNPDMGEWVYMGTKIRIY